MSIYQRIRKDRTNGIDRVVLSVIMNEIVIDGKEMPDNKAIEKLNQMAKVSRKSIKLYKDSNKLKQLNEEEKFLNCINNYLPKAATEDEIINTINNLGVRKDIKSMGLVMKELKNNFKIVDGSLVKQILLK